jgi:hypothetical protein
VFVSWFIQQRFLSSFGYIASKMIVNDNSEQSWRIVSYHPSKFLGGVE